MFVMLNDDSAKHFFEPFSNYIFALLISIISYRYIPIETESLIIVCTNKIQTINLPYLVDFRKSQNNSVISNYVV